MDGTFQTYYIGEFTGIEHTDNLRMHNDGSIWTARSGSTAKKVSDVELDCVWLVEKE